MISRSAAAALALGAASVAIPFHPGAFAGTEGVDPQPSADQVQKALEARKIELEQTKSREKQIESNVGSLDRERALLNDQLLRAAAQIKETESKLTETEDKLGALEAQEAHVRGSLAQRHGQIAKLLAALQRMGRNPPPVIVTKREDALEMVRSAMLLAAAFPGMKSQALEIAETLENLVRVTDQIRTERDVLRSETTRIGEQRTRLAGLIETKRLSITEQQVELKKVREAAREMARGLADLNELIAKFDKAVGQSTGLDAYNKDIKAAEAQTGQLPGQLPGQPPAEPGAAPVPTVPGAPAQRAPGQDVAMLPPGGVNPGSVVELAPTAGQAPPGNTARLVPAIPFEKAQAKFPMPASGRRVLAFGEKTQFGSTSKGLVIETRSGAQVTAPCDGWIVYAGEFRSYGQLLIINGGGGYHVVLAGLSQIDVEPGQFVLAAEPVGTMSRGGQPTTGSSAPSNPVLYIEFRKDGQPINPDPWWVETFQKAQG
ncbi:MAG: peptidoglycan DD-metalloendopeptidase family protein [Hyphomicrobium sp.]|nr:peptidoglycan DD-metalloendopeptidase family protein [Hyphomicrobium sp.]